MTKKEWLGRYRNLQGDIERTEAEIQRWRAKAENVTRLLSDMPKGGQGRNQLEDAVCAIDELEQELSGQILEGISVRKEIESAIAAVKNPVYRELLKWKYIEGHKLWQVAHDMSYSYDWVKHLHRMAVSEIQHPKTPNIML